LPRRASLRRDRLYVTRYQQEQNADVVLMLDTLSETGTASATTLHASLRAAAALAAAYLARKDRVGLIEYGGLLRWVRPGSGRPHFERLLSTLVQAEVTFTYVAKDLDLVPPRVLPPQALVIAIKKSQALLAYLALPLGQAHPRDKLAALLWGDMQEAQARAGLRQTLYTLRKILGDLEPLRLVGETVALEPRAISGQFRLASDEVRHGRRGLFKQHLAGHGHWRGRRLPRTELWRGIGVDADDGRERQRGRA